MKTVIVMPTLNPSDKFLKVVSEIKEKFNDIIVINDGSTEEYDDKFLKAKEIGCTIIKHEVNKGKGEGIKSGIKEVMKNYKDCDAIITVDSDGQHLPKDIVKVNEKLEVLKKDNDINENKNEKQFNKVVLGVRDFNLNHVPFKSKYGNKFSSLFFKLSTGVTCPDTQTGLRVIPKELFEYSLNIEGSRFEYEMNFLKACASDKIEMVYVPIDTVYESKKKHETHFRPIKDSLLIYEEQAKYITSAILSCIIDLTLFHLFSKLIESNLFGTIAIATVLARVISGVFNFLMNKLWAFKSNGKALKEAIKYLVLFIVQMTLSFNLVYVFVGANESLVLVKLIVDFALFVISYFIQKKFIFKKVNR